MNMYRNLCLNCVLQSDMYNQYNTLPLHSVDTGPGGYQGQNSCHQIHEGAWWVTLVPSRFPKLIQTRATDHKGWVQFHAIGAKGGILEKLLRKKKY